MRHRIPFGVDRFEEESGPTPSFGAFRTGAGMPVACFAAPARGFLRSIVRRLEMESTGVLIFGAGIIALTLTRELLHRRCESSAMAFARLLAEALVWEGESDPGFPVLFLRTTHGSPKDVSDY